MFLSYNDTIYIYFLSYPDLVFFLCLQYRFADQAAREIIALRNAYKELKPSNDHYGDV